jgi:hypothetical protein
MQNTVTLLLLLLSMSLQAQQQQTPEPVNQDTLKAQVLAFNRLTNQVFSQGSTQQDLDALYAMYTDDFLYEHPKYGGVYSRGVLYNNSLKHLAAGKYDGTYQQQITNTIVGEGAATIAWVIPSDPEKKQHMTLIEFNGDKIKFIKEYW